MEHDPNVGNQFSMELSFHAQRLNNDLLSPTITPTH